MRIALRTSGGRGEYEMAGSHGSLSVSDIINRSICLQIFPNREIQTNNVIKRIQGKPRIRLENQKIDKHIYLLLSSVLLMPKPKRELNKTPGGKLQLTENNYSIFSIKFDIVKHDDKTVLIQPTDLVLANSEHDYARIDIVERLRLILDIWDKAKNINDYISNKIISHKDAVLSGSINKINDATNALRNIYDIEDPLKELIKNYDLIDEYSFWMGVHRDDIDSAILEIDLSEPAEAAKKRIKQWRFQALRGSKGKKFSDEVKSAYNFKCLFSGYYLPSSSFCSSSGVDSAHILPWAEYDINSINNGICLNKLCHWAFDSGILILNYLRNKNKYELSISKEALKAEKENLIDLDGFRPLVGLIPKDRLPKDIKQWPSPQFLEEYNKSFSL